MKILLIQPPIQDFYQTAIRTQPIGLAYLAASLKARGHKVEILDCQTDRKRSVPIPPELSYLRDFYPFEDRSPLKLYSGYYRFGMGLDEIRKRIEDSGADVFGISSSFTPYHQQALEIARIIKDWDERKIVVMGGAHVSCDPEGVLESPFVDYVVLGEGEVRFPLLLGRINREDNGTIEEIDGIGYRKDGKIMINPLRTFIHNLDSLPYPARGLLDLDRYRLKRRRSTMIVTSRGCPHKCAYCSSHLVTGTSFRTRSPENILQEMKQCRDRYGIETFDIEDDNFTFDKERAKQLMRLIRDTFGEGRIKLTAMNGVSFASLDRELLGLMKRAGFHTINLSFVSTDISVKRRMGRPSPPVEFDEILGEAEKVGLHVIAYAILGMPGQTLEEMVDTLVYLMGRRVLIGPSIYYPTPGTSLFEKCKELGILPPHPAKWRSSAFPIENRDFNRLDMATLFRLTRMINFVKGRMDAGELREGMTFGEMFRLVHDKEKIAGDAGAKDKSEERDQTHMPCAMPYGLCEKGKAWIDLLGFFGGEGSFFGLKKEGDGRFSIFKVPGSKNVLDYFFEKACRSPILKTR